MLIKRKVKGGGVSREKKREEIFSESSPVFVLGDFDSDDDSDNDQNDEDNDETDPAEGDKMRESLSSLGGG